jgi:hypothetical protein
MTKEELLNLKQWRFSPEAILDEARIRGVKDIEISAKARDELLGEGFNEDVVDQIVPDDKIPIAALAGYKTLSLKRSPEYDAAAPEGWLRVTAGLPANSQSEFKFKHNGLFVKALSGGEPNVVSCSFSKPAPRNTKVEFVDFTKSKWGLEVWDQKGSRPIPLDGKSKDKPPLEVSYLEAEADGRNVFRVVLANNDKKPRQYTFDFYWRVLTTPKTSSASPK